MPTAAKKAPAKKVAATKRTAARKAAPVKPKATKANRVGYERFGRVWNAKRPNMLRALEYEEWIASVTAEDSDVAVTLEDIQDIVTFLGEFIDADERDDFLTALRDDEEFTGLDYFFKVLNDLSEAVSEEEQGLPS